MKQKFSFVSKNRSSPSMEFETASFYAFEFPKLFLLDFSSYNFNMDPLKLDAGCSVSLA